jgi:two-component system, OmpR family, KDP operon response regulator KdpE
MMDPGAQILVIEDDAEIRGVIHGALESAGCRVAEAGDCTRGLVEAGTRKPDLVILDLGLPDRDGVEFIREMRTWSAKPILVLSARTDEAQKVAALDEGADDYLGKPFGVAELLARIRAALRRAFRSADGDQSRVTFGDVTVDLANRTVSRAGAPVRLTALEFRLLATLLAHPGRIVTHRHLLREVWGPAYVEHGHYVRVYMGHPRQKLETVPARPRYLVTEVGVGYRFMP